jgi:hypothetical protein
MATRNAPSNQDDVIDSRDIIDRISLLEELGEERDESEAEELAALLALQEEANGSPDWQYGETLIRDTYFREYAQELAEDIGAIDRNASWPARCIDWDQAADELRQDYFSVEFDGATYWIRS